MPRGLPTVAAGQCARQALVAGGRIASSRPLRRPGQRPRRRRKPPAAAGTSRLHPFIEVTGPWSGDGGAERSKAQGVCHSGATPTGALGAAWCATRRLTSTRCFRARPTRLVCRTPACVDWWSVASPCNCRGTARESSLAPERRGRADGLAPPAQAELFGEHLPAVDVAFCGAAVPSDGTRDDTKLGS
jgi:hypothetical protein